MEITKWFNFGEKKRKLARQIARQEEYDELIKEFYKKHSIVAKWLCTKYLFGNHNGMQPVTPEGFEYQRRVKHFFGARFGEFPKSFNSFASVSYGAPNFDFTPVEKLRELYNEIEIVFPEPFKQINRKEKLKQLNEKL